MTAAPPPEVSEPFATPSDAALVQAARAREPWAFEALYRRYVQASYALAARLTGEHEAARDMVQDTFVQAFKKLDTLDEPAAFSGWLRVLTVRTVLMSKRRARTRAAADIHYGAGSLVSDDTPAENRLTFARVQAWIREVREPDRTVYLLRVVESCSLPEIAALSGMSLATVKRKVARVDEHMRKLGQGARDHE